MSTCPKLFLMGAALLLTAGAADAAQAGDRDDQFVVTGCVMRAADVRDAGPHSIMIWSRGDVYLSSPRTNVRPSERPVGTAGQVAPVFYWLDDEDDFARYAGQRVEIVGELSDAIREGRVEIEPDGAVTGITFDAGGREARMRVPTSWLGPQTRNREIETEVMVRTVDVEKVTVLGPCTTP